MLCLFGFRCCRTVLVVMGGVRVVGVHVEMAKVAFLRSWTVLDDFDEVHGLGFSHQVLFGLPVGDENNSCL